MASHPSDFDLEEEVFKASGVRDQEIDPYRGKLQGLLEQFLRPLTDLSGRLALAKGLFDWLWERKPFRYSVRGPFRLDHVIDRELSQGTQPVGNCLGLTVLYNCLLRRLDIEAKALYLENAFGIGPHVLTELPLGDSMIDIENILPEGFDYKGHLKNPLRTEWGDRELVADIYLSVGNESFLAGRLEEALTNYDLAIELNPHYEKARLNRAIVLDKMGR